MLRAQNVKLYNIMFPHEQAHQIISKIGWLGKYIFNVNS